MVATLVPIPRNNQTSLMHSYLSPTSKARMQSVHSTTLPRLTFFVTPNSVCRCRQPFHASTLLFFFCSTFSSRARLMCGRTPPNAIVARIRVSSSSSPRMASCKCRGVIRLTFRSLAALPASSRTSAVRYSRTAVT